MKTAKFLLLPLTVTLSIALLIVLIWLWLEQPYVATVEMSALIQRLALLCAARVEASQSGFVYLPEFGELEIVRLDAAIVTTKESIDRLRKEMEAAGWDYLTLRERLRNCNVVFVPSR